MDEMQYQENKSVGVYIFLSVFCLTLILEIDNTDGITWMGFLYATLYGGMILGLSKVLWYALGDFVMPYIRQTEEVIVDVIDDTARSVDALAHRKRNNELLAMNMDKRIKGNMLYARGAVTLDDEEVTQMKRFMADRWSRQNIGKPPEYASESLIQKLTDRKVLDEEGWITPYGKEIVPHYSEYMMAQK